MEPWLGFHAAVARGKMSLNNVARGGARGSELPYEARPMLVVASLEDNSCKLPIHNCANEKAPSEESYRRDQDFASAAGHDADSEH
ncbi:hypothetical protein VTO73DRAFT_5609 [Trametes versicolor]